jgi:hypothetical protein
VRFRPAGVCIVVLLVCGVLGAMTPAAQAAFGVSRWEAGTCKESTCNTEGRDPAAEFYTQAAGHPNFGITAFRFNAKEEELLGVKKFTPEGHAKDVRVDLPPGLAIDPEATPQCEEAQIEKLECPEATQVGVDEAQGTAAIAGVRDTVTEVFPVFNVVRKSGEPARFGIEVTSPTIDLLGLEGVIYLEGAISWHHETETSENSGVPSGDYHEFFRIQNIPTQPELIESKLIFWGVPQEHTHTGEAPRAFVTMPSSLNACSDPQTTYLHADSYENEGAFLEYASETRLRDGTAITATGCSALAFDPSLSLEPETSRSDAPDGARVDLHVPQLIAQPGSPDAPDLRGAAVSLPEGMTLNPSAARGLEGCSDAQIGLGTDNGIECPAGSEIGTVAVDAPGIPNGSLSGEVYLGAPEPGQGPESGREFRIFLAAEAPRYGVGIRLEGHVQANTQTGRLTAIFEETPQVAFEDIVLTFDGGPRAPLANPLHCGPAEPAAVLTPYTGQPPTAGQAQGFDVDADGHGGACPSPLPFALVQSTPPQSPSSAGAYSPFTLDLGRGEGQQYLSRVQVALPPGLLGAIPSVALCPEPLAIAGTCPSGSEIGNVSVSAGSGPEPYDFAGHVYLTGPYEGAPYGLSIVVPALAGPYDFGDVVTRAGIDVGLYSGRVVVTAALPTVIGGVPLRLRSLGVEVDRPNFLFNPTSCAPLASESLLTGFVPGASALATQSLSSPFQVGGCGGLEFAPKLTAFTGGRTSKANGASLEVRISQGAHQANIERVLTALPKQLVTRQSTLRKACLAATFEVADPPGGCSVEAQVGEAVASTPVLPGTLRGPVYLVSHGGEAFPDLDAILRGDGVEVVLVGHTHISSGGITSANFESLPDVPISSFSLDLGVGPHSALSAHGNLCTANLAMPTTLVAQNGARITQRTKISAVGCTCPGVSHHLHLSHAKRQRGAACTSRPHRHRRHRGSRRRGSRARRPAPPHATRGRHRGR